MITPDPWASCWRGCCCGIRRFPKSWLNGSTSAVGVTIIVEEMLTTAGKTLFTTGANVVGMVGASRTAGAAAATAAAGAPAPACIAPAPTTAPTISMMDPTIHNLDFAKRFMCFGFL